MRAVTRGLLRGVAFAGAALVAALLVEAFDAVALGASLIFIAAFVVVASSILR